MRLEHNSSSTDQDSKPPAVQDTAKAVDAGAKTANLPDMKGKGLQSAQDQAQAEKNAGIPPDPETPTDGGPRAELGRHLPPLGLDRNRRITPSNCSRNRSGYGPNLPIGRLGSMNFR